MPRFIKESILYKLLDKIFIIPFETSKLKKYFNLIINYIKQSYLFSILSKYFNKKPYFLNSFFYKIFRKILKFLDKILNTIHNFFKKLIIYSFTYEEGLKIKNNSIYKNFLIISILISALNFGYILGAAIFKGINVFLPIILFILSVIFCIIGTNENALKESLIFKFIKLFEI